MKIFFFNINYFINFPDFLTLPCYKESNSVSIKQMMSAILYFPPTLNRLFNNYIDLNWFDISSSWNMKEVRLASPEKLPSKSPALLGLILLRWNAVKTVFWNIYIYIYIYIYTYICIYIIYIYIYNIYIYI